jgi:hypothetical protein
MGEMEPLRDIEEIRQVRHRYLRCVDLKRWDELGETLTPGAALHTGTSAFGRLAEITGRCEIVEFLRAKLGPEVLTAHVASQPEIAVDGDVATGVWSYRETLLATKHRLVIVGTGFCEDRYERAAGRWRIARTGYVWNYEVMMSLDDLPSFKIIAALGGQLPDSADVGSPAGLTSAHGRR